MLWTVWIATSPQFRIQVKYFSTSFVVHSVQIFRVCLLFTPIWWRRMCHAQTSPEMFHPPTSLIPPWFLHNFPPTPPESKEEIAVTCDPSLKYLIQIKPLLDVLCTYKKKKRVKKKHKCHLTWLSVVLSPYHPPPQVSCIRSIPQIRPSDRLSFGRLSQVKTKMTKLPQQKNKNTLDHQKHNNNIKTWLFNTQQQQQTTKPYK